MPGDAVASGEVCVCMFDFVGQTVMQTLQMLQSVRNQFQSFNESSN